MKLTNNEIYSHATSLSQEFAANCADLKLPVKINFYLQKNIQTLRALAMEIEESRIAIIKQYGTLNEDGESYAVPPENITTAQAELTDLFNLEQEVQIYMIQLDNLSDDLTLTMSQMEALMFMIE